MSGRIIISGGTGLIGSQLSQHLLRDGYEVVILSREKEPRAAIDGAQYELWDGQRLADWAEQLSGAAAIINLAGANIAGEGILPSRWTAQRKTLLRQSRLAAGAILSRAAEMASPPPKTFIQASAVGFYGTEQADSLTEDAAPGEDFLAQLCQEWENSSAAVEALGTRHLIARIGVVLSKNGGALPKMALPFRCFVGGRLGSGQQAFSWIHIEDAVAALRFLMEQEDAQGAYNLTAPQPLSNAEFSVELALALRRPSWLPLPAFLLKTALGEVSQTMLQGQSVLPQRLKDGGFSFRFPEARSALQDLYRS